MESETGCLPKTFGFFLNFQAILTGGTSNSVGVSRSSALNQRKFVVNQNITGQDASIRPIIQQLAINAADINTFFYIFCKLDYQKTGYIRLQDAVNYFQDNETLITDIFLIMMDSESYFFRLENKLHENNNKNQEDVQSNSDDLNLTFLEYFTSLWNFLTISHEQLPRIVYEIIHAKEEKLRIVNRAKEKERRKMEREKRKKANSNSGIKSANDREHLSDDDSSEDEEENKKAEANEEEDKLQMTTNKSKSTEKKSRKSKKAHVEVKTISREGIQAYIKAIVDSETAFHKVIMDLNFTKIPDKSDKPGGAGKRMSTLETKTYTTILSHQDTYTDLENYQLVSRLALDGLAGQYRQPDAMLSLEEFDEFCGKYTELLQPLRLLVIRMTRKLFGADFWKPLATQRSANAELSHINYTRVLRTQVIAKVNAHITYKKVSTAAETTTDAESGQRETVGSSSNIDSGTEHNNTEAPAGATGESRRSSSIFQRMSIRSYISSANNSSTNLRRVHPQLSLIFTQNHAAPSDGAGQEQPAIRSKLPSFLQRTSIFQRARSNAETNYAVNDAQQSTDMQVEVAAVGSDKFNNAGETLGSDDLGLSQHSAAENKVKLKPTRKQSAKENNNNSNNGNNSNINNASNNNSSREKASSEKQREKQEKEKQRETHSSKKERENAATSKSKDQTETNSRKEERRPTSALQPANSPKTPKNNQTSNNNVNNQSSNKTSSSNNNNNSNKKKKETDGNKNSKSKK